MEIFIHLQRINYHVAVTEAKYTLCLTAYPEVLFADAFFQGNGFR